MKPFSAVAIPHRDILEGRLTMDIFAAELWDVFKGRAVEEYRDPTVFFKKTVMTQGLKNLLAVVEKRLRGEGGDSVIQLQTPFGGGKTHALIALYHKARDWNVNVVVIDGRALDPKETTIWEEIERQLTQKVKILKGSTAPGTEKLREVLEAHQPLLILMDEILEYTTRAAGIKVGASNLAAQVLAFLQELTTTVRTLEKCALIFSLPSSLLERYDENAETLYQQLQKIVGRMEKVYAPIEEEEVPLVVRRRLFSDIDEKEAREIVDRFVDFAEKEKILPEGIEKSVYRERFLKSYPFLPEVIDTLYGRWGSLPTFQKTRGMLRLLSLVIYSLKNAKNPYISLADFDLENQELRRELLKHIGSQFDSVIHQDITSRESGAKKVDRELGDAYSAYSFGTKVATSIFMYSFSGGEEKGATLSEIKRSSADPSVPSSIIADAVDKLNERAFYLWREHGKYFFTARPNLNRVLLTKMEAIKDAELIAEERKLLAEHLKKEHFNLYLWPSLSKEVPDTIELKLVILQDRQKAKEFLESYGERPRIHRNTLIFLCPLESERAGFENALRKKLAWQKIEEDRTLKLTPEQEKEVEEKSKDAKMEVVERVGQLYQMVLVPSRTGFKEILLGHPTYGAGINFDREVYDRLRGEEEIATKLSPLKIREKYLKGTDYVETKNLLDSFLNTPGETRIASVEVLRECIREGVKEGLFGLGYLENGKPKVQRFKEEVSPELVEGEVIISAKLCRPEGVPKQEFQEIMKRVERIATPQELISIREEVEHRLSPEQMERFREEIEKVRGKLAVSAEAGKCKYVELQLEVPPGRLSDVARMVAYLKSKFSTVDLKLELVAKEGEIPEKEYEEKIREALQQAGVRIKKEIKN